MRFPPGKGGLQEQFRPFMQFTVLHVITGLTTSAGAVLADVIRGGVRFRGPRQIVISLSCVHEQQQLRSAGIELHGLALRSAWQLPRVIFQLVRLMRNYRPDLVMTWHRSADCIGTIAAIASGVGAGRVIWNLWARIQRWPLALFAKNSY